MTDVQRADSAARRKAITIVIISAIVGSLLIVVFETYRAQLYEWLLSDHEKSAHRLRILIILTAGFGATTLFAFSVYLWSFGCKVSNYQRFPLPGQRVIRDTPILEGQAALMRGTRFKDLSSLLSSGRYYAVFRVLVAYLNTRRIGGLILDL